MPNSGHVQPFLDRRLAPRVARGDPAPGFGRRLRAAIILAVDAQNEVPRLKASVAEQLNISPRTLERMILDQRRPNDWEIRQLAELLKVPEWFLREGFAGATKQAAALGDLDAKVIAEIANLAAREVERRAAEDPEEPDEAAPAAG
jgi:hypothetical protein